MRPTVRAGSVASLRWFIPAALVVAGGVALITIHYYAGAEDDPEGWLAAVAFGSPTVVAGILASVGLWRGYPLTVGAASIALLPISFVSVVMWPLLIPAGLLILYAATRTTRPSLSALAIAAGTMFGLVAAFVVLLVHQDPVTWQAADGRSGGGASDIITQTEAAISLSLVAVVAVVAALPMMRGRPDSR